MSAPVRPAAVAVPPRLVAGSTGGLRWHWRALHAGRRWAKARQAIAHWLDSCPVPRGAQLLWIGASAGWMTPSRWLAGFREIEAIDLDPLARPLFGLRHGATLRAAQSNWRFHHEDGFESLEQLLTRWPQAVVLFDNVLGQMRYRYEDGLTLERRLSRLAERLQGRLWGSVHDWLSGPANPASGDDGLDRTFAFEMRVHPGPAGVPRLTVPDAAGAEDDLAQWLLARVGGYGVWQDHLTGGVFPGGSVGTLIPWSFSPTHVHWLQAAWVDARVRVEA